MSSTYALRDAETTAQAMGIDPVGYKLLAFSLSGFIADIGGSLLGFFLRDIDGSIIQDIRYAGPDNFTGKPVPGYDAP